MTCQKEKKNSPSRGRGDGLKISAAALYKVREDLCPIVTSIPSNFCGWINLNRHDLRRRTTFDDDNKCTDTTVITAALLTALDVSNDERITDICSWNNMSGYNGESKMDNRMISFRKGCEDMEEYLPTV